MHIPTKLIAATTVLCLLYSTSASAQTPFDRDVQVRASITIPFGGQQKPVKTKPRLEFGIHNYHISPRSTLGQGWSPRDIFLDDTPAKMQFGMTLSTQPQLLLNGVPYTLSGTNIENVNGVGPITKGVGIGVAASLVFLGALAILN